MIKNFENPVAIFASKDDADLECVSARRTHFNEKTHTATYVWILKGHRGSQRRPLRFDVWQGPEQNQVNFVIKGKCMLWVTKRVEDNVPQDCIDQFVDICGAAVPEYSRDLCKDDDDDYEEEGEA
ncbi:hypothetical protein MTO96_028064 [Rhipicephalus appendiculatus]